MTLVDLEIGRRSFLKSAAGLASAVGLTSGGLLGLGAESFAKEEPADAVPRRKPRVAAINSVYRLKSHAYHIAGRFIHGYTRNGFHHQPPFELVRMWNHQQPVNDLGPSVCEHHGIELCKTIQQALGEKQGMDIDAVLLIIEHGDYALNERHQTLYPRYEFFEQIVDVFKKCGRRAGVRRQALVIRSSPGGQDGPDRS